jgi:hypothetical protein
MKNFFVLIIILISTCVTYAQSQSNLTGKWTISFISMGVQHDYKTKKTTVPKEFEDIFKSEKEEDKFAKAFMMSFIELSEGTYYTFDDKGQFEEWRKGKQDRKGNYTFDAINKKLVLTFKTMTGKEKKEVYDAEIINNVIKLSINEGGKKVAMNFEKTS